MKIFITGATGFIGSELVKELLQRGHIVHALYRNPKKRNIPESKNLIYHKGDILDKSSLKESMMDCEIVFHLAAYAKVWSKNPSYFKQINVEGTRNVLSSAKELDIKKVIVTSTAGVLGPSGKGVVNEDSKRLRNFFTEYERTKYLAEQEIDGFVRNGLNVTTLLPTRVYGPGVLGESNSVTVLIQKYINGKWHFLPGNGKNIGNYVFIEDVINGHISAMEKEVSGEKFILGGDNISYYDFFNTIAAISGKKQWLIPLPVVLMMIASGFMWLMAAIFKIKPLITPGWVRKYLHHWNLSSQKAMSMLDYQITPLKKGLSETIKWLRNENEKRLSN